MDIITAEQAREITRKSPPVNFVNTVDYIFNAIKRCANLNMNFVEFHPDTTVKIYYNNIRMKEIIDYIESLGYFYTLNSKVENNIHYEWVTISW